MGVEVAGSDLPLVNGEAKSKLHDMENGKVNASDPIVFGSHGTNEEHPKGETNNVSNANVPKDAVEEWGEPQVHSFWFVRYRSLEDQNLKAKLDLTDKEIQKKSQQITQIIDNLKAKRSERSELIAELKSLGAENSQYRAVINEKREEMRPLQSALGTLRGGGGEKGFGICSTEEELNQLIRSLEYRMQHESLSLKEEKQLLREIKELETTRPKVIANAATRAKIQDSMGQKEDIQDQVKLLGTDLDGVRKQQGAVKAKMDRLSEQVNVIDRQIDELQKEFESAKEKKKMAVETIQQLRKKRDEGNAYFYQSRTILNNARELAAKKDVKALEELANIEVENFMSQWNSSKAFRGDYEKRILTSLDMRQLSRDGRMRNFDEKPLVMADSPRPSEKEVVPKATTKPQKEDAKPTSKVENVPAQKAQKESKKESKESKPASERAMEDKDFFVVEKPKKDVLTENEIDAAKLKEMKKEEEKEKQRQALERKKKLQEKAVAKAALRAQKEAEKKQKEREKKLKKKEASTAQPINEEEPTEDAETDEPEKPNSTEEAVETLAPSKVKDHKENAVRHRKATKPRGSLPKAILKKKKSANYWIWGSAAAAAVVVLMVLVLGYNYLL